MLDLTTSSRPIPVSTLALPGHAGSPVGEMPFCAPATGSITAAGLADPDVPDTRGWVDTLGPVRAAAHATTAEGTDVLCAVDPKRGVRTFHPGANGHLASAGTPAVAGALDGVVVRTTAYVSVSDAPGSPNGHRIRAVRLFDPSGPREAAGTSTKSFGLVATDGVRLYVTRSATGEFEEPARRAS